MFPSVQCVALLLLANAMMSSAKMINATSTTDPTKRSVFEATTTSSGLYYVIVINVFISWLGLLFYRYVILRRAGLLSPDELDLLRAYPPVRFEHSYTPNSAFVHGAPPMRWTSWRDFFTATDAHLARDAQVYLLFQRVCMATTAVCALVSTVILLPSYYLGGALSVSETPSKPLSLISFLHSGRGVFERFTSHNLPPASSLVLLQLPVLLLAATCIVVLHTLVHAATKDRRTLAEWLELPAQTVPSPHADIFRKTGGSRTPRAQVASFLGSSPRSPIPPDSSMNTGADPRPAWTLFARGLPRDIRSHGELRALLDVIFPGQIRSVELVCKGRMPEARLRSALSMARSRLDYLIDTRRDVESSGCDEKAEFGGEAETAPLAQADNNRSPESLSGLVRRVLGKNRFDREARIAELGDEISSLRRDLDSRKREAVADFLGCAFITVRSPAVALALLSDFPVALSSTPAVSHVARRVRSSSGSSSRDSLRLPPLELQMLLEGSESAGPALGTVRESQRSPPLWRLHALYNGFALTLPLSLRALLGIDRGDDCDDPSMSPDPSQSNFFPVSREFATNRLRSMKAERAPKSGDIVWGNVGISFFERTCREVLVQMFVFACLILFTSPVAMLTAMRLVFAELAVLKDANLGNLGLGYNETALGDVKPSVTVLLGEASEPTLEVSRTSLASMGVDDNAANEMSKQLLSWLPDFLTSNTMLRSVLLAYFPVLLLSVVFSLVPTILRAISSLEGYPTYTDKEMSIFRKTSFYYLMNAVLLPSLALNTASEFLEMVYRRSLESNGGVNVFKALPILQSLFSGDIAFFLCSYLVQLALTGSVFWLMRIPASASMVVRNRLAATPLEAAEAKCTGIFDFPRHYSYSVSVMAMCLLFGFMAPVIWYFAFLYFVCKHIVDTYLIRYVHPRSHIDGRLPRLASTFVLVWTCVSQLIVAATFYLQGRTHAGVSTGILCVVTLAACVSVGSSLGNRILGVIPRLRDALIRKFVIGTDDDTHWLVGQNSILALSASSTSTASLADSSGMDELDLNVHDSLWRVNEAEFTSSQPSSEPAALDREGLDLDTRGVAPPRTLYGAVP